jgi:hypothetical protein
MSCCFQFSGAASRVCQPTCYSVSCTLRPVLSFFASKSKSSSLSKTLKSQCTIAILEYCFGFCGACTWTDVAYGMPASIILLTVAVAAAWASLMVCCILLVSDKNNKKKCQRRTRAASRASTCPWNRPALGLCLDSLFSLARRDSSC